MKTEILLTCPLCRQPNFSERGIKAHCCRANNRERLSAAQIQSARLHACLAQPLSTTESTESPEIIQRTSNPSSASSVPSVATSSSSPMSSKSNKHALTVFADPKLSKDITAAELQSIAIEQIDTISAIDREGAFRFIYLGLTLHRLKSVTKHGQFGATLKALVGKAKGWTPKTCNTNASYAMRLASAFVEKEKITPVDLLAMPGDFAGLATAEKGPGKRLAGKLQKFIGEHTRTELLIKHGLSGVGLKTALENEDEDEPQHQQAEDYFATFAETLHGFRTTVINRDNLMRLTPEQLDTVFRAATEDYQSLKRLVEEAKGKTADIDV